MEYGITDKGFRRKTYQECLDERIARAKETYGVNIDTSETSVLGTLIRNTAWDEAEMWELAEHVYLSAFVSYSEGTSLDNVGDYITLSRRPATKARGIVTFEGESGYIIPEKFKIKTDSNIMYETIESKMILEGKADVKVVSIAAGIDANVDANTLTNIVNPNPRVESVANKEATFGGMDMETDAEFRERYDRSFSKGGGSTVDAIRAALLDMPNMADAVVKENDTILEKEGLPPKSVACYVFSNEDDMDIAQVILENKAGGIEAFGDTVVSIEDNQGEMHKIGFTRAKVQDIYVKLTIEKGVDYKGDEAVKRAVLNYIGGTDPDGVSSPGLRLGEDVILSKIMGAIMCMGGIADIKIELSKDGKTFKEANIDIEHLEVAITDFDKVVINHV